MKNLGRVILLAAIGFFAVVNTSVAQRVASPTEPSGDRKKAVTEREKEDLEKTYGKVAPQSCKVVVPTITPLPQYKRPAFDFVPARARGAKEREI